MDDRRAAQVYLPVGADEEVVAIPARTTRFPLSFAAPLCAVGGVAFAASLGLLGWAASRRGLAVGAPAVTGRSLLDQQRSATTALAEAWRPGGTQTCKVLKVHSHNSSHFTQGFEKLPAGMEGGWLESTGMRGQSKLLQLTGEGLVLRSHDLPAQYFGEGVTYLNGQVYQLTWQEDTVFLYDVPEAQQVSHGFGSPRKVEGVIANFQRREGWGLTNNGSHLIASDGSNRLYVLDPSGRLPQVEAREVPGLDPSGSGIWGINELEFADGKLFFNEWYRNWIGIYDWFTQAVSWIDCSELVAQVRRADKHADVLNGITFVDVSTRASFQPSSQPRTRARRLVLTGKLWPHTYEVDYEVPPEVPYDGVPL